MGKSSANKVEGGVGAVDKKDKDINNVDVEELKRIERLRKAKLKQQEVCERLNRKRTYTVEHPVIPSIDKTGNEDSDSSKSTGKSMTNSSSSSVATALSETLPSPAALCKAPVIKNKECEVSPSDYNNLLVEDGAEFWSNLTQLQDKAAHLEANGSSSSNANRTYQEKSTGSDLNGVYNIPKYNSKTVSNQNVRSGKFMPMDTLKVPERSLHQQQQQSDSCNTSTPKRLKRACSSSSVTSNTGGTGASSKAKGPVTRNVTPKRAGIKKQLGGAIKGEKSDTTGGFRSSPRFSRGNK